VNAVLLLVWVRLVPNYRSPTDRALIRLMLVMILWRWRFVFNASILFPANFASADAGVGGRLPWLKYFVEQGVIGLDEIFGVFVVRQCVLLSAPSLRIYTLRISRFDQTWSQEYLL
jgi:hypothetical protein